MTKKLYIGNLPFQATDADLQNYFSQAGSVVSAKVIMDRESGRSRGFGFVEMSTEEDAAKAIEMLHQSDFQGRKIMVSEARESTGGGGGRSGGGGGRGGYGGGGGGGGGGFRRGGGGRDFRGSQDG